MRKQLSFHGGLEFPLTLATVAVAVAATGPGRFSTDRLIGWDENSSGLWWGVAVAAAAAAITCVSVTVFAPARDSRSASRHKRVWMAAIPPPEPGLAGREARHRQSRRTQEEGGS